MKSKLLFLYKNYQKLVISWSALFLPEFGPKDHCICILINQLAKRSPFMEKLVLFKKTKLLYLSVAGRFAKM